MTQLERPQEEVGRFCAMLRDLQRISGQPSLAVLRRSMPSKPGTSTLSDLLAGKTRRPPRWDLVSEFVAACTTHASQGGRELPAGMTDLSEWRRRHDELVRIIDAVQRAGRAPAAPAAPAKPSSARWLPVADWNPLDLGVHRAIDVSGRKGDSESRLTPYVSRPHDQELRDLLTELELPAGVFLVGESSTGKTRCCVEAVRSCVSELPIAYPADARDLCEILDRMPETGRFLLWLDEAHRYLDGDGASEVATRLTKLILGRSKPILIVGTLWPDRWRDMTAPPVTGQPDHSASARQFLTLGNVKRIWVPGNFSDASEGELNAAARRDQRLSIALMSAGQERGMTQVLAGGVQLVERYQVTLDVHSRAVLTAAMDCSRLEYRSPIPRELLTSSLDGYLSRGERVVGPEVLNIAFERATRPVNGIAALDPVRTQPGLGDADAYILHDYLRYFTLGERRLMPVPASTWEALDKHASDFGDRVRLGWQAVFRHYERLASHFLEEVIEAEHAAQDCLRLVSILEHAGHFQRAQAILERAARAGDHSSMRELADRRRRAGDHVDAIYWLRTAANLKDTEAMLRLGSYPETPELSWQESEYWIREAAEAGSILAMRKVAAEFAYMGAPRVALEWLRRGAETREGNIILDLVKLLDEIGEKEESRGWIDRLIGPPQLHMAIGVTEWLVGEGRASEAEAYLRRAMPTGEMTVASLLADLLEGTHGSGAAVAVWRGIIESRRLSGMSHIVAKSIVRQIRRAQEERSAAEWLRAAVNDNCPHSALILVELEDPDDAENLLRESIRLENFWAMPQLVILLERENRSAEAESLLRETVEAAPFFDAWRMLIALVERIGRPDEAEAMRRFGIEPGGQTAIPW